MIISSSPIPRPLPNEANDVKIAALVFASMTLLFFGYKFFRTYMTKNDDENKTGMQLNVNLLHTRQSSQLETHTITGF